MNNGYFTKDNLTELVSWFQVGESVHINQRTCGGMVVGSDLIRRDGDHLTISRVIGCTLCEPKKWTPYNEQIAGQIAKKLMKNRQRRKAERDRLSRLAAESAPKVIINNGGAE